MTLTPKQQEIFDQNYSAAEAKFTNINPEHKVSIKALVLGILAQDFPSEEEIKGKISKLIMAFRYQVNGLL